MARPPLARSLPLAQASLTPTHLAIVMEYAAGGELFSRIAAAPAQRFGEPQARFFFRQLIAGVNYVHSQNMAHRDLKLENTLLMDTGPRPRLAICDFGYTKSSVLHSAFHTNNVGTPSYLAPELLTLKQGEDYDGKAVDVWAAGVVLYVMLVGGYPFGDVGNGWDLVKRIATASYTMPVPITPACTALFARIFVVDPKQRATVGELVAHPWVTSGEPPGAGWKMSEPPGGMQSREALQEMLREATTLPGAAPAEDEDGLAYTEADHEAALLDAE